jgi:diguanylate cyclase (GGDEF)-like protein
MGNVVSCLGLAIGATETLPLWAHGAASYGFMAAGLGLVLKGVQRFCGGDLSTRKIALITLVGTLLPAYFAVIEPSLRYRLVVTGLFFGVFNVYCALTLWTQLKDETRRVMWASLLGFLGLGLALIVRALYIVWFEPVHGADDQSDLVVSLTLLVIPIAQVSAGFGLMVMVAHKYAVKLNRLSMLDSLTGAYNRSALDRLALRTLNRAHQSRRSVCVAMVDADHFKNINDTYGHPVGDQVLQHLVGILSAQVRPGDLVVRYGGEEFLLVFDGLNLVGASHVAERLRETVERTSISVGSTLLHYRISIGISCTDTQGFDLHKLVAKADSALYQAKQQGRNRVCVA